MPTLSHLNRRRFVQGVALAGGAGGLGLSPVSARAEAPSPGVLTGTTFDLVIAESPINITGRARVATSVNGLVPGPQLRWREGDTVDLRVTNRLMEPSSIHWHGITRAPADMDGVPGLSFRGIGPGKTFTYRIPVRQTGTYWYHSHSGMQEQTGLYGAIVIAPRNGVESHAYDREHVILLSDWTDEDPMTVVANLKQQGDYYNYHQRTVGTLAGDITQKGFAPALRDAAMWWKMRMTPTDLEDVSGATYTYLVNGAPPRANWTGLFEPGERVRLRFINGSSMSFFDVRIPGLKMSVVQTDGWDIHPVEVDEFRIGVAETYDVIVTPRDDQAYTVFAQSLGRTGYARATLAPRLGMSAPVPAMDPVPQRTMKDMGMGDMQMAGMDMAGAKGAVSGTKDMAGMASRDPAGSSMATMSGMAGMEQPATPAIDNPVAASAAPMAAMPSMSTKPSTAKTASMTGMTGMAGVSGGASGRPTLGLDKMAGMGSTTSKSAPPAAPTTMSDTNPGMAGMAGGQMSTSASTPKPQAPIPTSDASGVDPAKLKDAVDVDNVAMDPVSRIGEAGDGLDGDGRRVLRYTDLRGLKPGPDQREPSRELVFHLTGNMQRWTWGFDGRKFEQSQPVELKYGERVRFTLINDTMMEHPIHLHGLYTELENGQGENRPLKHTVIVKPGEKLSYLVSADNRGHWAYHCHLLYHMETGMFRTVVVS